MTTVNNTFMQLPLFGPTKRCSQCEQEKPLDAFDKASNQKSGYRSNCKECRNKPKPRVVTSQTCNKRHIEKPIEEFHKSVRYSTGHRSTCKDCSYELYAPLKRKNPEATRRRTSKPFVMPIVKTCYACHQEKPLEEFSKDKYQKDGHKIRCKACDLAYRQSHKDEAREYRHAYHQSNQEEQLAKSKQRYLRRREQVLIRTRAYNDAHKEQRRIWAQAWQKANPLRVREIRRKRVAREKENQVGEVSYERILERDGLVCHICGGAVTEDQLSFEHVIPLERGGEHSEDNIKVSHLVCNKRKGTKLMSELTAYDQRGIA